MHLNGKNSKMPLNGGKLAGSMQMDRRLGTTFHRQVFECYSHKLISSVLVILSHVGCLWITSAQVLSLIILKFHACSSPVVAHSDLFLNGW